MKRFLNLSTTWGAEEPGQGQVLVVGGECLFSPTDKSALQLIFNNQLKCPHSQELPRSPHREAGCRKQQLQPLGASDLLAWSKVLFFTLTLFVLNSPMRKV